MIAKCRGNCKHPGQDSIHGAGFRVLNHRPSKDGNDTYVCTVCKREHTKSEAEAHKR